MIKEVHFDYLYTFFILKVQAIFGGVFRIAIICFLSLWCVIVVEISQDPVKVETLLLKICHKKRKDVSSPIMQVSFTLYWIQNNSLMYKSRSLIYTNVQSYFLSINSWYWNMVYLFRFQSVQARSRSIHQKVSLRRRHPRFPYLTNLLA